MNKDLENLGEELSSYKLDHLVPSLMKIIRNLVEGLEAVKLRQEMIKPEGEKTRTWAIANTTLIKAFDKER